MIICKRINISKKIQKMFFLISQIKEINFVKFKNKKLAHKKIKKKRKVKAQMMLKKQRIRVGKKGNNPLSIISFYSIIYH